MLEKDPRRKFRTSRFLRVLVFSLLASITLVSLLIVVVRFIWDGFVAEAVGGGAYNPQPLFIVPSMGIIAFILAKILWDAAEGRAPKPRRR